MPAQLFYREEWRGLQRRENHGPVAGGRPCAGQIYRAGGIERPDGIFSGYLRVSRDMRSAAQTIEKYGDRWLMARPLPSSGPYELVDWRLNDRIRLRKNPRYWDAANTQSEIIDILPIGSPDTAFNLYESGAGGHRLGQGRTCPGNCWTCC